MRKSDDKPPADAAPCSSGSGDDHSHERPVPRSPMASGVESERSSFDPIDPERVSAALMGGPPVERFSNDVEHDERSPDAYLGTVLGERYAVETVIGEGGMGRVYLARHRLIDKQVAIKILHVELARDKEAVGRFVREAKAASSIGNPHIVDVSDFGETPDGSTYFVMEYLDGVTLADLLDAEGVLPPKLTIHLGRQMCDGLAAAHAQGIIHRDLKPDNIVVVKKGEEDFAKILDFGIAKVSGPSGGTKLTIAGAVFGTPHYMSPEQAAGTNVDHRADVYSLGILLYEMASGELPFNADNFMGILTQHMYRPPSPIRSRPLGAACPPALEAVILKCLAKRPAARYATMEELGDDLARLVRGEAPLAVTDPTTESARFLVPAEFLSTNEVAVVPAIQRPAPPKVWSRVATGVAVGLVVGGGALLLSARKATTTSMVPASAAPQDHASEPLTGAPRTVLLHSPTPGAVARLDGEAIALPTNLEIPAEGSSVTIEAPGHLAATIELAGDEGKVEVLLTPMAPTSASPRDARPARRGRPAKKAVDGVVDPWPTD
jgi:eukaryotic-like serine/threonine-protein kinase